MPSSESFCYNGHQLPAMFLIGAQKCGTTSFSKQLMDQYGFQGGQGFDDGLGFSTTKEHHFFNIAKRYEKGLGSFASGFPACETASHVVATIDATPNYFMYDEDAARLASMYGRWRLERTTFAILLCDPVSRAQSAWYHFHSTQSNGHSSSEAGSFKSWSHAHANDASQGIWAAGMYGQHLDAWLAAVGHVVIIPSTTYFAEADVTLTHLVAEYRRRSGRPAPHGRGHSAEAFSANHHSHPSLSSDHFPSDRAKIKALFAASNEHVYDLVKTDRRVKTIPYGRSAGVSRAHYRMSTAPQGLSLIHI